MADPFKGFLNMRCSLDEGAGLGRVSSSNPSSTVSHAKHASAANTGNAISTASAANTAQNTPQLKSMGVSPLQRYITALVHRAMAPKPHRNDLNFVLVRLLVAHVEVLGLKIECSLPYDW
jgi:hypothetical protein